MEQRQRRFSLWYSVATVFLLLAIQTFLFAPHTKNLSYSDFKALMRVGKVADLTLTARVIIGRLTGGPAVDRRGGAHARAHRMEAIPRAALGKARFIESHATG
jgi:hypothetical protein